MHKLKKFVLSAAEMARIALPLLEENGGFTLDEYGTSMAGNLWAVFVEGHEFAISGRTLVEIEQYLLSHPLLDSGDFFGGWTDDNGVCYLDHAMLFAHKNTAIFEAMRQEQKAIFNLETKETIRMADLPGVILVKDGNIDPCEDCDYRNP